MNDNLKIDKEKFNAILLENNLLRSDISKRICSPVSFLHSIDSIHHASKSCSRKYAERVTSCINSLSNKRYKIEDFFYKKKMRPPL